MTSTPTHTAPTPSPTRRRALGTLAALPLAFHAPMRASTTAPLRIAQSTALSGPLGELGQAMHQGAKACFAAINAKGGVNGRPIELAAVDDGYDVKRALANVKGFIEDSNNFALFNCMGTPMIEAMLPQVIESGIPFFAPFSGALSVRPKNARNVFNIRASYADEAEQLVQHLATVGIKRIAIVYQNNSFGKEVFDATQRSMTKHKLDATAIVTVENNSSDAGAAAAKIATSNPEAVLVGLAGKPTIDFVKATRMHRKGLPLYALSIMGAAATLKAMGDDATGIAISQVVPLPNNTVVPMVREFQQAWKAAGATLAPSHLALEGYVNARAFAEALRRAGNNPTRNSFIDNTWNIKRYDLGGFELSFTDSATNASRFVELTMVSRDGRFIR
ncbi:ABC transporter substrate-binding protein [Polaromonas sp. A23]|uniref:ABC transporter substrate-binding protein n=1 Tax=Polaromonas sp. A23 TaxID=1944133 RepID=UPI000986FC10|nr:ABC transporter substrate-binding protein [Polaromonas sp. A23]OOG45038.1 ABC transporter substrate-binding protein [Polaromonas sp. A23]